MLKLQAIGLTLSLGLLAACSHGGADSGDTSVFQHLSIADNGDLIAHAQDSSEARITAAGDLDIGGKPVAVAAAQREVLKSYHADAMTLHNDAVATGKAGADTGLTAVSAVAHGLAGGNPDSIDAKVNASANKVEALAQTVCHDLARLYADQGKVVAAIPAFDRYATIEPREISDCHAD